MGVLDKRIQAAVNQALQPLEGKLLKMAEDNAVQNRELMLKKAEEFQAQIKSMVKEEVKKALEKK